MSHSFWSYVAYEGVPQTHVSPRKNEGREGLILPVLPIPKISPRARQPKELSPRTWRDIVEHSMGNDSVRSPANTSQHTQGFVSERNHIRHVRRDFLSDKITNMVLPDAAEYQDSVRLPVFRKVPVKVVEHSHSASMTEFGEQHYEKISPNAQSQASREKKRKTVTINLEPLDQGVPMVDQTEERRVKRSPRDELQRSSSIKRLLEGDKDTRALERRVQRENREWFRENQFGPRVEIVPERPAHMRKPVRSGAFPRPQAPS